MWGAPARAPPGLLGGFSGPFTDSDRRGFAQRNPSLPLPLYAGVSQKLRPSAVTPGKVEDPRSREKLCGKPGPGGSLLARWPLCCVARQSHSQTLGFWALQGQVDVSGCRPHSLIRKYIPQLFFFFFGAKPWAKDTALTNNRPLPSWSPECVKGDSHVTPEV